MANADVAALIRDGRVMKPGGPPLLAGLAAGLVADLLQAVNRINGAAVAFVPKVPAIGGAPVLPGPFMGGELNAGTHRRSDALVAVGGS
jgi:flagellar biosynthesis protein FliQ